MFTIMITILPVFLIVAAGFAAGRFSVLGADATGTLNRFVIWLAMPSLLFDVIGTTDWTRLWNPGFVAVSMIGSIAMLLTGLVVGRMRGQSLADMAVDGLNASFSNSMYIGLPLLTLVLGHDSRPLIVVAGTLTLTTLFTMGVILIECGESLARGSARGGIGGAAEILMRVARGLICNPMVVAPVAGLLWWMSGLTLPQPIHGALSLLGAAATPAALVAIGLFLSQRPLTHAATDPFVMALALLKLVVHPALTAWLAWTVFALPPHVALTVIAVAALPTGTGPFVIAEFYARDGRVTSGAILFSTIASIATIAAILGWLRV